MKENPNIIFLYRLLAYSHYELGNCNDGIPAIEQFFQRANEKKILASDYEYYGKLLSKCGRDSLAIEKLKMAVEKDTLNSELWGEIGNAYMKMKKYPETISAYKRKIKAGKGVDVNDFYVLGRAYYYSKQFGQADTAFAEIVRLRPDIPTGYQWRAKANAGMDPDTKKGLAKPFYEEYIGKIKPEETEKNKSGLIEAYEYLGYYHMLAKDYSNAKCIYTRLKEIDPNNVKAKKALGDSNLQKATCSQ
jgi:tetratricopeptide (TPR) repeat protein